MIGEKIFNFVKGDEGLMDKCEITNEQFKKLVEDIYTIGHDTETIVISDFLKVVEKKILSLIGK
ncbi:hypothetical protein F4694_000567 [Bacillus niacini]|uniref:Uncharacterized protein n=1 Tax=Neobacillus niacini TaxID=86668 RepID=A0A852T8J1_9BACI|nr:hypothetical protein [Neobacillus niacini]NYE03848.1 hypothetical protein [Neobacillus niacini]